MKTQILIALAVVAWAATTVNVGAYERLLTPRAAGNQIHAEASAPVVTANYVTSASTALLTPRAAGNQMVVVKGTDEAAFVKCDLVGTPKTISLAGSQARMSCCGMTVADCTMTASCGK